MKVPTVPTDQLFTAAWLKLEAEANILCISETFELKLGTAALKLCAALNISFVVVTLAAFHISIDQLKSVAPSNIPLMSDTLSTFHLLMSLVANLVAPLNIFFIVVTFTTFQQRTNGSFIVKLWNIPSILETSSTFHVLIAGSKVPVVKYVVIRVSNSV